MIKFILIFFLLIILLHHISTDSSGATTKTKKSLNPNTAQECNKINCVLPLCQCSGTKPPGDLKISEVPMMVGLTFNGIIESSYMEYLKKVLNPVFKNPHGCPIQATFFVSDPNQDSYNYCNITNLFNNNNEIGVGSIEYK